MPSKKWALTFSIVFYSWQNFNNLGIAQVTEDAVANRIPEVLSPDQVKKIVELVFNKKRELFGKKPKPSEVANDIAAEFGSKIQSKNLCVSAAKKMVSIEFPKPIIKHFERDKIDFENLSTDEKATGNRALAELLLPLAKTINFKAIQIVTKIRVADFKSAVKNLNPSEDGFWNKIFKSQKDKKNINNFKDDLSKIRPDPNEIEEIAIFYVYSGEYASFHLFSEFFKEIIEKTDIVNLTNSHIAALHFNISRETSLAANVGKLAGAMGGEISDLRIFFKAQNPLKVPDNAKPILKALTEFPGNRIGVLKVKNDYHLVFYNASNAIFSCYE